MILSRSLILICVCILFGCDTDAQVTSDDEFTVSSLDEFLQKVEVLDSATRVKVVLNFLDTLKEAPIIVEGKAYFIYEGSARNVQVAGDFTGWSPSGRSFTNVKDTDLWYRIEPFEPNARLDYKLVVDDSRWILDPKNSNRIAGGFGSNSELAMPEYEQPWEIIEKAGIAKGSLSSTDLVSSSTGKTYMLQIYLPSGYDDSRAYGVAFFQDGGEYVNLAKTPTILDNLIAKGFIEPIIAVFVTPNDRGIEYAFEDRFRYRDFFTDELVPFIDQNYSTKQEAAARAVIGDSYGGNISSIIAFSRPEVFGNCGIHSGAYQPNNFETNSLLMDGVKKNIKVVSIWGTYEGSIASNMKPVKDYLIANQYEIAWKELPEGHSWGLWRATIDDMLMFFFPKS